MAITVASQATDVGSIPIARSRHRTKSRLSRRLFIFSGVGFRPLPPQFDVPAQVTAFNDDPRSQDDASTRPSPTVASETAALHHRRIRSFVTRAGRVSTGQRRAIDELGPRFVSCPSRRSSPTGTPCSAAARRACWKSASAWARRPRKSRRTRPADDFLGVEVHEPGVGALLKLIGEQTLGEYPHHSARRRRSARTHDRAGKPRRRAHLFPRSVAQGAPSQAPADPAEVRRAARVAPEAGRLYASRDRLAELRRADARSAVGGTRAAKTPPTATRRARTIVRSRSSSGAGCELGHGVWDLVFQRAARNRKHGPHQCKTPRHAVAFCIAQRTKPALTPPSSTRRYIRRSGSAGRSRSDTTQTR